MSRRAIVLFAHGARNADWARPFENLKQQLGALRPGERIELAFLELMQPTLEKCVAGLQAEGIQAVKVVPVFFGLGGHLKNDLPRLVRAISSKFESIRITVEPPIGEQPEVIAAIAQAVARRSG